ncbi:MAG: DUF1822 family protein [Synechococcales bacterium]|nr:DUF1822 family protein [Synechococcales bacterium]
MTHYPSDPLTFTAPVSLQAHQHAQQICQQQGDRQRATQIYLNVLAVAAVRFYLTCMGVDTRWDTCQSADPVLLAMMDTADLELLHLGKVECRPVLPQSASVHIPLEVWGERLAYVAVQFDDALQSATLLGFVETVQTQEVPLAQLKPLDDLLPYLQQVQESRATAPRICLSRWLENWVDDGWRSLDSLLGSHRPQLAFSFRTNHFLADEAVGRAKLLDLGLQFNHQSLALLIAITPTTRTNGASGSQELLDVLVQLHPGDGLAHLPAAIHMSLCSESGQILQDVRSRHHDNYIQLKRFRGIRGECFDIEVSLGQTKVVEKFMI